MDASRAINLFEQADVPIIGLVENMAGYACPHCGEVSDPFGSGGAEAAAGTMGLDFLGRVPLSMGIRLASDDGVPPAAGTDPAGEPFHAIAAKVADWLAARKKGTCHGDQRRRRNPRASEPSAPPRGRRRPAPPGAPAARSTANRRG